MLQVIETVHGANRVSQGTPGPEKKKTLLGNRDHFAAGDTNRSIQKNCCNHWEKDRRSGFAWSGDGRRGMAKVIRRMERTGQSRARPRKRKSRQRTFPKKRRVDGQLGSFSANLVTNVDRETLTEDGEKKRHGRNIPEGPRGGSKNVGPLSLHARPSAQCRRGGKNDSSETGFLGTVGISKEMLREGVIAASIKTGRCTEKGKTPNGR